MGAFGAPTIKPSCLHRSSELVLSLARTLTSAEREAIKAVCTEEVVVKSDDGKVSGGPDLKATQEYPRGCGEACAAAFEAFQQRTEDLASDISEGEEMPIGVHLVTNDLWPDSSLEAVCRFMKIPHDRLIG